MLLRLVTVGDGPDDVRRRVLRQELTAVGGPGASTTCSTRSAATGCSASTAIRVTRSPTVEIAHEALLTEWARLRGWIDDSRDDLRQHRRLAASAAEWRAADHHADYLLGGSRLDQLVDWAAATDLALDQRGGILPRRQRRPARRGATRRMSAAGGTRSG